MYWTKSDQADGMVLHIVVTPPIPLLANLALLRRQQITRSARMGKPKIQETIGMTIDSGETEMDLKGKGLITFHIYFLLTFSYFVTANASSKYALRLHFLR